MPKPPFAADRPWRRRESHAHLNRRVYYDPETGFEYERDPRSSVNLWHEINPRTDEYRDVDPMSGKPIVGSEGRWRPLR